MELTNGLTVEDIARVVHQANAALQAVTGDPHPSQPWDAETAEVRESAIEGVRKALQGRTPRELHDDWCAFKRERGWTYGPVKDPLAKTHPCLVPYDQLPPEQRLKDRLFLAITAVLV
jgi:hypothetical protein